MPLFEPLGGEAEIREAAKRAKRAARQKLKKLYELAIDYLENRQTDDVENELRARFPSTQMDDPAQRIFPVTVPLTERFVTEAANAYSKPVLYELTWPDGKTDEQTKKQTDNLRRAHDATAYGEKMARNEQLVVLIGGTGIWYEAKRGKMRAEIRMPHDIYPVAPKGPEFMSATDPDDYAGFVIELFWATEDVGAAQQHTYLLATNAQFIFFTGESPDRCEKILSIWDNPYQWEQTFEELDIKNGQRHLKTGVMPGRMLTFWHRRLPLGQLIPDTDPDIAFINREINVQWSRLFDSITMQADGVPVFTLNDPKHAKARRKYGSRFPLNLEAGEAFELVNSAQSFSEQAEVLRQFVQVVAVAKRQSPNDFSIEQQAALSGFAKVVDSLPKMEDREQRIWRLKHVEEHEAWPPQRAVLLRTRQLDAEAEKMVLKATYADVEFPQAVDERVKEEEHDLKHNFTSRAKLLAEREGITVEEAIEVLKENREQNEASMPVMMDPLTGQPMKPGVGSAAPQTSGSMFGGKLRKPTPRKPSEPSDD